MNFTQDESHYTDCPKEKQGYLASPMSFCKSENEIHQKSLDLDESCIFKVSDQTYDEVTEFFQGDIDMK